MLTAGWRHICAGHASLVGWLGLYPWINPSPQQRPAQVTSAWGQGDPVLQRLTPLPQHHPPLHPLPPSLPPSCSNGMLDVDSTRDQKDQVLQRLAMAHFKLAEAARLLGQWQAPTAYRMARCGDEGAERGEGQCHAR